MQNILIYGATSAIAGQTARLYAARGDRLFLIGRNIERLNAVAADLTAVGAQSVGLVAADLDDFERHGPLLDEAALHLGNIDVVLVAHGLLDTPETGFAKSEQIIKTNFTGVVSLLEPVVSHFETRKRGTIAVISSVAGDRGKMGNPAYGAAKGGLSVYLQGLRNELHGAGVHVVTIKPGFVDTPMTAAMEKNALFAKPADVARCIVRAIDRGEEVVYCPRYWRYVMMALGAIPEGVFKRMQW